LGSASYVPIKVISHQSFAIYTRFLDFHDGMLTGIPHQQISSVQTPCWMIIEDYTIQDSGDSGLMISNDRGLLTTLLMSLYHDDQLMENMLSLVHVQSQDSGVKRSKLSAAQDSQV